MVTDFKYNKPYGSDYRISDIDDLLNRLGESLQLDTTRRELAEQRYKTIAEWIESDWLFFKSALLSVYPQGSFRIRTTVKPYKQNEFDLDFVVHLDFLSGKNYQAMELLDQLERRLGENELYKNKLERKNRCIRITYANDFHMDIMVGCQQEYYDQERLLVPDRKTKHYTPSNPKGYGNWFLTKAELKKQDLDILLKAHSARNPIIRLSENLPAQQPYEFKLPLERAVQIFKRYRDVHFYNKPELATSSIILTTLAAGAYQGELSVFETIDNIIKDITSKSGAGSGRTQPFRVPNPANPDENFSEKWFEDRALFESFIQFIKEMQQVWDRLKNPENDLTDEILFEKAFGEARIKRLMADQQQFRGTATRAATLTPIAKAAGLGTLYTTPDIKPTFKPNIIQNQPARRFGGKFLKPKPSKSSVGTLGIQQRWIQQAYPGMFRFVIKNGILVCRTRLQPHDACEMYKIRIEYSAGTAPQVFIDSHKIIPKSSIHMYSNETLCLHYPGDINWKHRTSLASYTVPWICEWIVCYELWKITGK